MLGKYQSLKSTPTEEASDIVEALQQLERQSIPQSQLKVFYYSPDCPEEYKSIATTISNHMLPILGTDTHLKKLYTSAMENIHENPSLLSELLLRNEALRKAITDNLPRYRELNTLWLAAQQSTGIESSSDTDSPFPFFLPPSPSSETTDLLSRLSGMDIVKVDPVDLHYILTEKHFLATEIDEETLPQASLNDIKRYFSAYTLTTDDMSRMYNLATAKVKAKKGEALGLEPLEVDELESLKIRMRYARDGILLFSIGLKATLGERAETYCDALDAFARDNSEPLREFLTSHTDVRNYIRTNLELLEPANNVWDRQEWLLEQDLFRFTSMLQQNIPPFLTADQTAIDTLLQSPDYSPKLKHDISDFHKSLQAAFTADETNSSAFSSAMKQNTNSASRFLHNHRNVKNFLRRNLGTIIRAQKDLDEQEMAAIPPRIRNLAQKLPFLSFLAADSEAIEEHLESPDWPQPLKDAFITVVIPLNNMLETDNTDSVDLGRVLTKDFRDRCIFLRQHPHVTDFLESRWDALEAVQNHIAELEAINPIMTIFQAFDHNIEETHAFLNMFVDHTAYHGLATHLSTNPRPSQAYRNYTSTIDTVAEALFLIPTEYRAAIGQLPENTMPIFQLFAKYPAVADTFAEERMSLAYMTDYYKQHKAAFLPAAIAPAKKVDTATLLMDQLEETYGGSKEGGHTTCQLLSALVESPALVRTWLQELTQQDSTHTDKQTAIESLLTNLEQLSPEHKHTYLHGIAAFREGDWDILLPLLTANEAVCGHLTQTLPTLLSLVPSYSHYLTSKPTTALSARKDDINPGATAIPPHHHVEGITHITPMAHSAGTLTASAGSNINGSIAAKIHSTSARSTQGIA